MTISLWAHHTGAYAKRPVLARRGNRVQFQLDDGSSAWVTIYGPVESAADMVRRWIAEDAANPDLQIDAIVQRLSNGEER